MPGRSCRSIENNLSAHVDGELSGLDRQVMLMHLAQCPSCALRSEQVYQLRRSLQALPTVNPPAQLNTALRVLASRELARRNSRVTVAAMLSDWRSSARVWMNNLMRPFALPVAGGLVSTLMLFGILMPSFIHPARIDDNDIPIVFYTEASVRSTGPLFYTDDVEVELNVDEQGRVVNYTLPPSVMGNPTLRRTIEGNLLITRFNPATTFGQPISGKVKLSFRKLHIEVKG